MVTSLSLAEKQREFWQSVKDCFILKSTKWKSNTDQSIRKTLTYHGARSQDGSGSGSRFHGRWNKDKLGSHSRELFHCQQKTKKKILGDMLELILHLLSLGCLFSVVWTWLCCQWHTALLLARKQRWPRHGSAWQSPPSAGQPRQPRQPGRFPRCHHGNHPSRPNRGWQLSRLVRKLSDCFQWDLFPYFFPTLTVTSMLMMSPFWSGRLQHTSSTFFGGLIFYYFKSLEYFSRVRDITSVLTQHLWKKLKNTTVK